eukprot:4753077-Lingulodinium_polyedra.AAC.1
MVPACLAHGALLMLCDGLHHHPLASSEIGVGLAARRASCNRAARARSTIARRRSDCGTPRTVAVEVHAAHESGTPKRSRVRAASALQFP